MENLSFLFGFEIIFQCLLLQLIVIDSIWPKLCVKLFFSGNRCESTIMKSFISFLLFLLFLKKAIIAKKFIPKLHLQMGARKSNSEMS